MRLTADLLPERGVGGQPAKFGPVGKTGLFNPAADFSDRRLVKEFSLVRRNLLMPAIEAEIILPPLDTERL